MAIVTVSLILGNVLAATHFTFAYRNFTGASIDVALPNLESAVFCGVLSIDDGGIPIVFHIWISAAESPRYIGHFGECQTRDVTVGIGDNSREYGTDDWLSGQACR